MTQLTIDVVKYFSWLKIFSFPTKVTNMRLYCNGTGGSVYVCAYLVYAVLRRKKIEKKNQKIRISEFKLER